MCLQMVNVIKILMQLSILYKYVHATEYYLNDECIVSRSYNRGTCRFVNDCPIIVIEALEKSMFPTLCGFQNGKEIICCPNQNQFITKPKVPAGLTKSNRVSAEKCTEYQKKCTSKSIHFNFASGEAELKEFPYAALLGYVRLNSPNYIEWLCGGSLISENFIITAANCIFRDNRFTLKYVRVGDLDYDSHEDDHKSHQFYIIETFTYPFYKATAQYEDIALLKIDAHINFNDYIRPACLSDANTMISEHVIVAGWGSTEYRQSLFSNLQRIQLTFVPHAECNISYASRTSSRALRRGIVNATQLCAVAKDGDPDACQGFSGSALLNTHRRQSCLHEIAGITSFGVGCGIGIPSVYTRISAYLDWIEDIVWLSGNGSSSAIAPPEVPIVESSSVNRTFVKKCHEYHDTLSKSRWIPDDSGQNQIEIKVTQCPVSITSYIVDGENAIGKEFPHMALVGFESNTGNISWSCGGSLISERFVLTAAHCTSTTGLGFAKYVLLGELDYASDDDDARPLLFNIVKRIRHPKYTSQFKYNDIALLRLDHEVTFNDYIRPACLPESSSIGFNAKATGWGRLDYDRPISTRLQKVELDLFTHKECDELYKLLNSNSINRGIVNDTQICAGTYSGRGDTCQGDSGGPLQVAHNKHSCMYTIVGITSFGVLCGSGYPGIYTRVSSYIDWIESVVWPSATLTPFHEDHWSEK